MILTGSRVSENLKKKDFEQLLIKKLAKFRYLQKKGKSLANTRENSWLITLIIINNHDYIILLKKFL